jgi:hypothetical protein
MRALVCLPIMLLATAADAATGDAMISVSYKVKAVRLRPQPNAGVGAVSVRVVLHADGTIDDVVEAKGGKNTKKWEMKDRKLGERKDFSAQWRVIDASTLERRSAEATFDYNVKVVVSGKACKADVSYTLHAGQKEYVTHSAELDRLAYYSELRPFDVKCNIK